MGNSWETDTDAERYVDFDEITNLTQVNRNFRLAVFGQTRGKNSGTNTDMGVKISVGDFQVRISNFPEYCNCYTQEPN